MLVKVANPRHFRDMHSEALELAEAEKKIEEFHTRIAPHEAKKQLIFNATRDTFKPEYLKGALKGGGTGALITGAIGGLLGGMATESLAGAAAGAGIGAGIGGLFGAPIGMGLASDKRDEKVRSHLYLHDDKYRKAVDIVSHLNAQMRPHQSKIDAYHAKIQEKEDMEERMRELEEQLEGFKFHHDYQVS